ncbi:MAG: HlyD family efflux transporter periplasmic adaptor subunit [Helicobacteraceae bacterium]|nr:HlyD family efflux transporter periplasmic adaptor subunit [Helicobacteraceae bacterium]
MLKNLILTIFLLLSVEVSAFDLPITGTVVSYNQKMIGARYMGYIKHIYFDIGDSVEREDTLWEMESAEFDILKSQADLALEQANSIVDMYQTRMNTIKRQRKTLAKQGMFNSEDMQNLDMTADNVQAGLASAQVLVKNAASKIKQVATITGYLEIKAPNAGIIVEKKIRVGDLVAPGMLGMIIVDLDHLQIESEVAESDLKYVNKFQKVKISIPSINYNDVGYIKSIVPSANPMAHTFKIIINFKKKSDKIFPGMYAKILIKIDETYYSN